MSSLLSKPDKIQGLLSQPSYSGPVNVVRRCIGDKQRLDCRAVNCGDFVKVLVLHVSLTSQSSVSSLNTGTA